jgi:phosphoheptose isomerase
MVDVLRKNADELCSLMPQLYPLGAVLSAAADVVSAALFRGNKILACGNGGSASDASHLTTEFVSRFDRERRPYPAISLCVHGGDLTAIGNDYDFQDIFARQVAAFGKPQDVLVVLSTSGKSENVRRALIEAKSHGVITIALLGRGGGNCVGIADFELLTPGVTTARIQELQQMLIHSLCEMVEDSLEVSRGNESQ